MPGHSFAYGSGFSYSTPSSSTSSLDPSSNGDLSDEKELLKKSCKVIDDLKSQGLFDKIRKQCLGDIDTYAEYQVLQRRITSFVNNYLNKQTDVSMVDKLELRENLRTDLSNTKMFKINVEALANKAVSLKLPVDFRNQMHRVVCDSLGVSTNLVDTTDRQNEALLKYPLPSVTSSLPVPDQTTNKFLPKPALLRTSSGYNSIATISTAPSSMDNMVTDQDSITTNILSPFSQGYTPSCPPINPSPPNGSQSTTLPPYIPTPVSLQPTEYDLFSPPGIAYQPTPISALGPIESIVCDDNMDIASSESDAALPPLPSADYNDLESADPQADNQHKLVDWGGVRLELDAVSNDDDGQAKSPWETTPPPTCSPPVSSRHHNHRASVPNRNRLDFKTRSSPPATHRPIRCDPSDSQHRSIGRFRYDDRQHSPSRSSRSPNRYSRHQRPASNWQAAGTNSSIAATHYHHGDSPPVYSPERGRGRRHFRFGSNSPSPSIINRRRQSSSSDGEDSIRRRRRFDRSTHSPLSRTSRQATESPRHRNQPTPASNRSLEQAVRKLEIQARLREIDDRQRQLLTDNKSRQSSERRDQHGGESSRTSSALDRQSTGARRQDEHHRRSHHRHRHYNPRTPSSSSSTAKYSPYR